MLGDGNRGQNYLASKECNLALGSPTSILRSLLLLNFCVGILHNININIKSLIIFVPCKVLRASQ
jgi:hypothetical protein